MLTFKNIWMINFDTFVFNTYKTPPQKKNQTQKQAKLKRTGQVDQVKKNTPLPS